MKVLIISAIILSIIFIILAASGKKNIIEDKENASCLTLENYLLIRDSPNADELSEYTIHRKTNELRFTRKGVGYTLFYLKLENGEPKTVKLRGLDGYGIRDREFLKYICNLVKEIKEKNK